MDISPELQYMLGSMSSELFHILLQLLSAFNPQTSPPTPMY